MDDNVIHDWSDGKRCIGLSDQEIIQRYKEIAHKYRKDQRYSSAKSKFILNVTLVLKNIWAHRMRSQISGE